MTDHALAFWTVVTSAISAAGTLAATVIALYAATAWSAGLRQQRADEFVAAMNDCAAAIGRAISRKQKTMQHAPGGLGIDEAWASWARLRTTYAVVRRYYPCFGTDFPERGSEFLRRMEAFCDGSFDKPTGDAINNEFNIFGQTSVERLSR
jgi:hypothetical protein